MTRRSAENRTWCPQLVAALLAWAMVAAGWPAAPAARADKAAASLEKYKVPVDNAIDAALKYLAARQLPDGSFPGGMPRNTAITALGVMAFLAKGHTPGVGPYGENINRGIDSVLAARQSSGLLSAGMRSNGAFGYSHCIATLMLSEVSGMVDPKRQEKVDEALSGALKLILAAQKVKKKKSAHQGGWRYQHTSSDSDISCTGWALMALRSARNNGAAVPDEAIAGALKFVMNCRAPTSGGFCYQPGQHAPGLARTGTALLCLELCGQHRSKTAIAAGDWILQNLPKKFGGSHFFYGLYYTAQGMFQLGGEHWERFAVHMYESMLRFQLPDGSWPVGPGQEKRAGLCYSTAMGVLAMSVTYRQLPIYQR